MKICLLMIGKTTVAYAREGLEDYARRLKHYVSLETRVIPGAKHAGALTESLLKEREGELILSCLEETDTVVLLDERGTEYSSVEFSAYLERKAREGARRLVFVTGGAYGFSGRVYERARERVSLSRMTFSHQMARVIFLEQLYRAMTIARGEAYHHE
ncbi:MAG: 23S rRNA (pseudouridine(1915)-N(3))-methyltransferase RlmH [Odoribacteraceae bacterium]|jgi:23S rRNA (pseudouridine1915-N3)-methyltransferase|nr:23S rRNA (pseudouridine(1915)-N(3))-methyltransferase RlmH [Odoribacteraceae bacterium]